MHEAPYYILAKIKAFKRTGEKILKKYQERTGEKIFEKYQRTVMEVGTIYAPAPDMTILEDSNGSWDYLCSSA